MRYEKPEVQSSVAADAVIAGSTDKSQPIAVDANPVLGNTATHAAYPHRMLTRSKTQPVTACIAP